MCLYCAAMNETNATGASEKPPTTPESRRQERRKRFVRVAARRTQQVLNRLRLLSKCANRAVYDYSEEDVAKIFDAIAEEVAEARRKFEDRARKQAEFKL